LFNYPNLKAHNTDNGRFYEAPNGELYPSVTTVLGEYYKDYYDALAKKIGRAKWEKLKRLGADRGTKVHDLAESYLKGEADFSLVNPGIMNFFVPIKNFLDANVDEVLAMEQTVYSNALRMAGRFDLLARLKNGTLCYIDFKTSTHHKERKDIDSYYFQCTAYCTALRELFGLKVDQFCIVITEEGSSVANTFYGDPNQYIAGLVKLRRSVNL
jgi:hypothetical protein